MANTNHRTGSSAFRLIRFLAWYGVAVAVLFYVLPMAGHLFEDYYDMLSNSTKFFSVLGLFLVIAAWQILDKRDRIRAAIRGKDPRQVWNEV
jgi:hypothetical protein